MALATTIAFSNAARVMTCDGVRFSRTMLDDALAGGVGHLRALAVGRGDGGAAGQRHAQRLGQRSSSTAPCPWCCSGRRWAPRPPPAGHEALVVDLALGQELAGVPHDGARADLAARGSGRRASARRRARWPGCSPWRPPSARPASSCRSRSSAPRRRAGSRAAPRPGQVGEVAVERRGRAACPSPAAGARGTRAPRRPRRGCPPSRARPAARWWRLQGTRSLPGLGDADDRPARLQLVARQAVVEVALEVERGHARVRRVVEPALAAQRLLRAVTVPPASPRRRRRATGWRS